MSHRPEQVASVIRRAVQEVLLRGVNDPRVRGMVSVTRVTVDPDLAEARIQVSVLPAERAALTLLGLKSAAPHLERKIRGELHARRMPHLKFELDDSLKKVAALEASIDSAISGSVGDHDDPSAEGTSSHPTP